MEVFEIRFEIPDQCYLFLNQDGSIDTGNIFRLVLSLTKWTNQIVTMSISDDILTLTIDDPPETAAPTPTHFRTPKTIVAEIVQNFATILWTVDGWHFQPGVVVTNSPERYGERYGFTKLVSFREEGSDSWTVIVPTSHK